MTDGSDTVRNARTVNQILSLLPEDAQGYLRGICSMSILYKEAYRSAFTAYLRSGTPIGRSLKQAGLTEGYVWYSQRDERVRRSHRINDGRVFFQISPPDTGHPGEGYNCRCEAVPYIEGATEFGFHEFSTDLTLRHRKWTNIDFVQHYYAGAGRPVDLLEIGHLDLIAEQYAYGDGKEGAFRRLADQIADVARQVVAGPVHYAFGAAYDFENVAFSHGDGVVRGEFTGIVEDRGNMLRISGASSFEFSDIFADPLDIGIEVGGTPYHITGNWRADFLAEVFKETIHSRFVEGNRQ